MFNFISLKVKIKASNKILSEQAVPGEFLTKAIPLFHVRECGKGAVRREVFSFWPLALPRQASKPMLPMLTWRVPTPPLPVFRGLLQLPFPPT